MLTFFGLLLFWTVIIVAGFFCSELFEKIAEHYKLPDRYVMVLGVIGYLIPWCLVQAIVSR